MTVSELREWLDDYDGDLEVRLATQPSYPLQSGIRRLWQDEEADESSGNYGIVYILEGDPEGYFVGETWY